MAFSISLIISMWLIFKKLGEKGWKSIIPIYNNDKDNVEFETTFRAK